MKTTLAALTAAVLLASAGLSLHAENALDDALPAAEPKKIDPAGVLPPKPAAPKETVAPAPEMVSPEATKGIDKQGLIDKLAGQAEADNKLKEVVKNMGDSESRLKERDPGVVTQEIQNRVIIDLDVLIEIAKKQQQQQSSSSSSSSEKKGEKREQSQGQQQGQGGQKPGGNQEGGSSAASSETLRGGGASAAQSNGTDIREKGSEWGGLPPKDRDLISNGVNEQFLPMYKDQIRKYYEALAEIGKAAKDK